MKHIRIKLNFSFVCVEMSLLKHSATVIDVSSSLLSELGVNFTESPNIFLLRRPFFVMGLKLTRGSYYYTLKLKKKSQLMIVGSKFLLSELFFYQLYLVVGCGVGSNFIYYPIMKEKNKSRRIYVSQDFLVFQFSIAYNLAW